MKKTFTKEERKEYFQKLREEWKEASKLAETDEIKALYENVLSKGIKVSAISFALVLNQLQELKLKGIPYIDTKTFKGWKELGFIVKKGEKAKIHGITYLQHKEEKEEGGEKKEEVIYSVPKVYSLFHKSQVKVI